MHHDAEQNLIMFTEECIPFDMMGGNELQFTLGSIISRVILGHSTEQVRGHQLFLSSSKPVLGYNGAYGYRRNTPSLRRQPSPFGRVTDLPLH
ncbi:UNVERIFIED_CONTAM: hypothetical protein K2H54_026909 [Gekko kuhli]